MQELQQIVDEALIDEASRMVTRHNDLELTSAVFHPRAATLAEGDIPVIMSTCPPTGKTVIRWVKSLHARLNVRVAAPDLTTIMQQCIYEMAVLRSLMF